MAKEQDSTAFKHYFDRAAARALAQQVSNVLPQFDQRRFVKLATTKLEPLAFQARVQQFADALRHTLPENVPAAMEVLTSSLPPLLTDCEAVTDGFLQWPLGQFIADHGVPYFEESMTAMVALTQRFSAEFAVRPFVEARPSETFARLSELTDHESPHVRRWCSEGTRPRLPWGKRLAALVVDPGPIWPILEALRDDSEPYVSRSVANNLNDISKDHPKQVVARCRAWSKGDDVPESRQKLVKHALRSLVKEGDPAALAVVGYRAPKDLDATLSLKPKRIEVGDSVLMRAALHNRSRRSQKLLLDYAVYYVRQRGKTGKKVFKWTTLSLPAGERKVLEKRHFMRETTIRALYSGAHKVEIQVNGHPLAKGQFFLT